MARPVSLVRLLVPAGLLLAVCLGIGTAMLVRGPWVSDRAYGAVLVLCGLQVLILLRLALPPRPNRLAPSVTEVPGSPRTRQALRLATCVQVLAALAAWFGFLVGLSDGNARGTYSFVLMPFVMTAGAGLLARVLLRGAGRHRLLLTDGAVVHEHAGRSDAGRSDVVRSAEVGLVRSVPGPPPAVELVAADGRVLLSLNPRAFDASEADLIVWLEERTGSAG